MVLTPDNVLREYVVADNPASGVHKPLKSELRLLLNRIMQGSGVSVTRRTRASLFTVTPASGTFPRGEVTSDPNPTYNGWYVWSGSAWEFGRGFETSLARMTVTGGSGNAVLAEIDLGVSASLVVAFLIKPVSTNTGPVTLNGKAMLNVNGDALGAGEFPAGRMIVFTDEGANYQLVSDPAIDAMLAQAIDLVTDATQLSTPGDGTVTITKLDAVLASTIPVLSTGDKFSPCIAKTGNFAAVVKAGTIARVGAVQIKAETDTAVSMPSPTIGEDYVVFAESDGGYTAVAWTANTGLYGVPPAYPTPPSAGAVVIGGFHYAPGGNGGNAQTGGNTTPQINPYSIWDLEFRPACPDPRAKAKFGLDWMNIYRLGIDHDVNGPSRHGVAEANHNGAARPKRPLIFGGNGSAVQTLDAFAAQEIAASHGQRLPTYLECTIAFFGVTEGISRGIDPVTTGFDLVYPGSQPDEKFTSWCGIMGATGSRWVWCSDVSYAYVGAAEAYYDIVGGRGKAAHDSANSWRQVLAGGKSNNALGEAGSRCFDNANAPNTFGVSIGARFVAAHSRVG